MIIRKGERQLIRKKEEVVIKKEMKQLGLKMR